ncbi:tRNA (guanine26-N2)-dimethyltransferase KNAG_0H03160 [Huiozyma naganishii CBS 8797]|uniref:tRNA (guanine(26)-N(2))-dimethyltransferase n=1 Tax=Huiozyma naganishii (strain ATCC MYA-139 / BCRC 22969 / CBS 8797 / KCTC 17520 / NBRC 10181 / NCYC 3082 / Yp74L-3) TaxID=1071383 RepID=J7S9V3_HUIN7|nr:hypothetical protein KNAG_0H03160 [Kazachstania naganishii CBS 8797]CCK71731.1 hypothetical protein KNAG_0H03160 [Kazachstania naganishii CBS 8797]
MWKSVLQKLIGRGVPEAAASGSATPEYLNVEDFNVVEEGKAQILFPKRETVFYNPVQQFNRDLSVTCIKAWDNLYGFPQHRQGPSRKRRKTADGSTRATGERYMRILEALSATGLRAIRYANELPHIQKVVANDLLPAAVESIARNARYNGTQQLVQANEDDANVLMHRETAQGRKFHVVDLDPYGTVTPFVDAAVQSVEDGGLMLVTCTDLSVLAGNGYPEKCFALYGGVNMVSHEATHESALRLVVQLLAATAAKYKKNVEPLLCLSIDFYVRVFVRVTTSPLAVKNLQSNTMVTYHCSQCGSVHNQFLGRISEREGKKGKTIVKYSVAQGPPVDRRCQFCGGAFHLAGPMYGGPLHNREFIEEVLRINSEEHTDSTYKTRKRIEGMATLALNELPQAPFYFSPNMVSSVLKLQVPPLKTVAAGLGSLGYNCSLTHAQPSSLKTDAPWEAIWYTLSKCAPEGRDFTKLNERTPGYKILSRIDQWMAARPEDSFDPEQLSFEPNEQSGKIESLRKLKIVRYQENPTKNWGPKARPQSS